MMFLIARICSMVRTMPPEVLCAGVSVVSMGVWLPGEALDPAMVVATSFVSKLSEYGLGWVSVSQRCRNWEGWNS